MVGSPTVQGTLKSLLQHHSSKAPVLRHSAFFIVQFSCPLSRRSHPTISSSRLLLPPSIFPNIRVFSKESALRIRWSKYWSFSFNISPSNEHPGLISFRMEWLVLLQSKGLSRVFSNITVQKHQFFGTQLSL